MKIKADLVNISDDTIKLAFTGNVISNKFLCFGFDNPYVLIERARLYTEQEMAEKKLREQNLIASKNKRGRRKNIKLETIRENTQEDAIKNVIKSVDMVKDWVRVYKSDFKFDKSKDLHFHNIEMKMSDLCANKKILPLRISVRNYQNAG